MTDPGKGDSLAAPSGQPASKNEAPVAPGPIGPGVGPPPETPVTEPAPPPERISLEELTAKTAPAGDVEERITALQRVGYKLALYVLALIAVSTGLLMYLSFGRTSPVNPPGPLYYFDQASLARYERAVALYREAAAVQREMLQQLFRDIVITAFLPTFTAILGYIFGSRENASRKA